MSYENVGRLTPREQQAAELARQGLRNKQIAARLTLKESTVEQYLSNVYGKVGVDGRGQLMRMFSTGNHSGS